MRWVNPCKCVSILFLAVCLQLGLEIHAQSPIIKNVGRTIFTDATIYDMVQDRYGLLWIGSSKGLFKYDGKDFREVDLHAGRNTVIIYSLFFDRSYRLWLGRDGGVTCFDGTTIKEYDFGGDGKEKVTDIIEDRYGTIWFSSASGKLYRTGKNSELLEQNLKEAGDISTLSADRDTYMLSGTFDGRILIFKNQSFSELCQVSNNASVRRIVDIPGYGLFIGTTQGLFQFDTREKHGQVVLIPGSEHLSISRITLSDSMSLWIGSETGLYYFNGNTTGEVNEHRKLIPYNTNSLLYDREGNLWIGTADYGIFQYFGNRYLFFDKGKRPETRIARCINKDLRKRLWIGYFGDGLEIYEDDKLAKYNMASGFISDHIRNSFLASDGTMWVVTTRGLARFVKEKVNIYTTDDGLANNYGYQVVEDKEGNIWIATWGGLSLFDGSSFTTYSIEDGISNDRIEYLLRLEQEGGILVSTQSGIDIIENRKVSNLFNPQDLNGDFVKYMTSVKEDEIWCGTNENRLLKLDLKTRIIEVIGDPGIDGWITFMIFDRKNRLLIGMQKGIMVCEIKDNRIINKSVYGSDVGLNVSEINRDAYYLDDKNQLWIGTENGVYIFNPDLVQPGSKYPLVSITAVNVPQQDINWSDRADSLDTWHNIPVTFTIPYHQNDFIFRFRGNSLNHSEDILYRCRLDGYETTWTKPFTDEFVLYNNLSPGKYEFSVQGSFDGLIWSDPGNTIQFQITPPFWRAIWFYMIIVSVLLLLFILYNNYRMRLRIQQFMEIEEARVREAEKIRKKVAMDFHDEVGNQLSGISILAQLIRIKSRELPDDLRILLERIDFESKKLFQGTKDFIWSIDPRNDNMKEVYFNIRDYAEDIFDNSKVVFHSQDGDLESLNLKLPAGYSRQLVLIFKEGLENILKHADCRNVYFSMLFRSPILEIRLRDDGVGFDMSQTEYVGGLKRMQERSNKLKSKLIINSRINEGTEITIKITFPDIVMNSENNE